MSISDFGEYSARKVYQNLLYMASTCKIHILNAGVEPSIFNWSSVTPLPWKPPKDRSSSSTKACTSTTCAGERVVMSHIETVEELGPTCPLGEVEVLI